MRGFVMRMFVVVIKVFVEGGRSGTARVCVDGLVAGHRPERGADGAASRHAGPSRFRCRRIHIPNAAGPPSDQGLVA